MVESAPFRERLAALEHQQWMEWSQHIADEEDLSDERADRWKSLWKPYSELSEDMKEHDRKWADKILDELRDLLDKRIQEIEEAVEDGRFLRDEADSRQHEINVLKNSLNSGGEDE